MGDDIRGRRPAALLRCETREFLDTCPRRVAEMFHYWDGLRQGRAMPQRRDFHPEKVPYHLSGVLLIDIEGIDDQGIGIYRYRVVGTDEVRLRGHDPTGKLVRDGFFWPSLEEALEIYESVRRRGGWLYGIAEFTSTEGRWCSEYYILLPFSEDGEAVTQILVYSLKRSSRDR